VECAMRDEEMADVDVTSPGVWDRESDADYRDLVQKEAEDEANGIPPSPSRPQARGDRLTEKHVKVWLTLVGTRSLHASLHRLLISTLVYTEPP
jgi:hypothetical protein